MTAHLAGGRFLRQCLSLNTMKLAHFKDATKAKLAVQTIYYFDAFSPNELSQLARHDTTRKDSLKKKSVDITGGNHDTK